ncbi:fluoride efflux transporter FluC [Catenuloplanes atrovinosus]|uniref:Fluoride-specific ion channel FluC n=1 Tax=Catenuloplanes atrovinosus TaxID=137266 RepID=A0AAE3YU70_9ACTN|nr:CrcB family protein [Catenuloplanes atrovinosus]MDR7280013.1 CrcB protein [Catenuloplanes atrovinosus]
MTTLGLVLIGGAAGAVARLLLDTAAAARLGRRLPWGILAANVLGSLLLGLLHGSAPGWVIALAGSGFCGALTTWSTLAADTVRLAGEPPRARGVLNLALNLALGLSAAALGAWLAP